MALIATEIPKTKTSLAARDVVFLVNPEEGPEPKFVSLVRYGANGTPFNIVKNVKSVNQEDFMPMKVLQSVVTMSGVGVDVVKAAFNDEVREAVNLAAPKASGSFIVYEQAPRESFKSDSLEVVALNADNSIFGIQGELTQQDSSIVAKLFKKPVQKSEYIGMADADVAVSQDVLKSRLSNTLWEEQDALRDLIRGVLGQENGDSQQKIAVIQQGMNNFLESIRTAVTTFKCEKFEFPAKSDAPETQKAPESSEAVGTPDAKAPEVSPDTAKQEAAKQDAGKAPETQPAQAVDTDKAIAEAVAKSEQAMAALVDGKMQEVTKSFQDSLKALQEEIVKTMKAPAAVVLSHTEDPIVVVDKSNKETNDNAFKGCFGNLSLIRRQ
jgi:hypothetical protein